MALTEYGFADIDEKWFSEGEDPHGINKAFVMILLLGLILLGSITMINLFVAVVLSDVQSLEKDVYQQVRNKFVLFVKKRIAFLFTLISEFDTDWHNLHTC